jgi:3',5'-cyclic AMP phosphodiesterase CpdA
MAFSFVHCSDIHLLSLVGTRPRRFLNKRLTGGLNLLVKRRRGHDGTRFDRIVTDAEDEGVDRLVITGDLTNLALESEFEHVAARLRGSPVPVTVIPGNHDTYTRGSARARRFERHLADFMVGERIDDADYPFVQRFDEVALVGCSSAVPSLPLLAVGRLGPSQIDRLDTILERLGDEGLVRIVLIHHPVIEGHSKPRHDLVDLRGFARVIRRRGADLVLHGHEHALLEGALSGPGERSVPVHGIASGTSRSSRPGHEAAYSIYRVEDGRIAREVRIWRGGRFERLAAFEQAS